ncbi:MAG: rRNA maturation RNase YbeY [Candidatus Riflebacteria bacterium]|nr:rRNA maturation RNase YbeY [Candidatus Riflebacteria bacterium]
MALSIRNSARSVVLDGPALSRYFHRLVARLGLRGEVVAELVLCGTERIRSLKQKHFGVSMATDCIAFGVDAGPMKGGVRYLGEVWLCPRVCAGNARRLGRSLDEELLFVFTHGVLHLLGWDDSTERARERMYRKQTTLLDACRPRRRVVVRRGTGR